MNKKGSVWSLLIVAVVALGFMAMVSFEGESTGAFSAPKPPMAGKAMAAPKPPIAKPIPPIRVVDRGPDTVIVDDAYDDVVYATDTSAASAAVASVQLQCYAFRIEHPGKAGPEISRICASYGVSV